MSLTMKPNYMQTWTRLCKQTGLNDKAFMPIRETSFARLKDWASMNLRKTSFTILKGLPLWT